MCPRLSSKAHFSGAVNTTLLESLGKDWKYNLLNISDILRFAYPNISKMFQKVGTL